MVEEEAAAEKSRELLEAVHRFARAHLIRAFEAVRPSS